MQSDNQPRNYTDPEVLKALARELPARAVELARYLLAELQRQWQHWKPQLQQMAQEAKPRLQQLAEEAKPRLEHLAREAVPQSRRLALYLLDLSQRVWAKVWAFLLVVKDIRPEDVAQFSRDSVAFAKSLKDPQVRDGLRRKLMEDVLNPEKLSTSNRVRMFSSIGLAVVVTTFLFFFMQTLINTGDRIDQRLDVIRMVDATMPELDLDLLLEVNQPEAFEEVIEEQPETPEKMLDFDDLPTLNLDTSIAVDSGLDIGTAGVSSTDGEYLPLVTIVPDYPERAAQRGIEGWCLVRFTVDANGNVVPDSIVVEDADPPNLFDRSSIRAARRFRFQPRVMDGKGVEVPGVPYLFTYKLDDESRR